MTEEDKKKYMTKVWHKLLRWESISEQRELTHIEEIVWRGHADDYDLKVKLGWPDVSEF